MANKQLTAKVRLNTTQAEQAIDRLSKKINSFNNALSKGNRSSTAVDTGLKKATNSANRLTKAVQKTDGATKSVEKSTNILNTLYNKSRSLGEQIYNNTRKWYSAQGKVANSIRGSNQLLSSVWGKLKGIAATYLGIMGMKTAVNTTDMITSAENKLNYVNSQQQGGTNTDGSYTAQTFDATQDAMDKMYTSAQKVRMGYTDMMTNVSKSMTLAGESFDGNIDRAIRFQEIMAEAYAVGGASAAEMSSSMYQMIQALGAGTLAGDELRSVREGAPLAYKAIEEFAQGVYNTEESLKDLASQGKVTSDMVVAAIMGAGDKMDSAFKQTEQTFAQTWEQIKNAAVRAFSPIADMLRQALNEALENGLIEKVENFFNLVSKGVQIVVKVISNVINWIVDNWVWVEGILVSGLTTLLILLAAVGVASFVNFLIAHWQLILITIGIFGIVWALYAWQQGLIDTATTMTIVALIIAAAFIIIGIAMNWTWMIWVGVILAILAVAFYFFEYIAGAVMWVGALIVNIILIIWNIVAWFVNLALTVFATLGIIIINVAIGVYKVIASVIMFIATRISWIITFIVNLTMGLAQSIIAISHNIVAAVINVATALGNSISAICQNIGIAFSNAWNGALSAFWNFVAGVLDGLKGLEPAINAIAELFGVGGFSISGLADAARNKASTYQQKSYVSVSDAWSTGMNSVAYKDVGDAWSTGWNTLEYADMSKTVGGAWNSADYIGFESVTDATSTALPYASLLSLDDAYDTGANWGSGVKDAVNNWGADKASNINDALGSFKDGSFLDNLGNQLGLDFSGMTGDGKSISPDSIGDALNGSDLGKNIGAIADNTGSVADSMDLTEEDLDYLRRIADMEWKKEYTTASITVDMSNYNTINGESDLDGIVTKLSDKLYEELNSLADGVYA